MKNKSFLINNKVTKEKMEYIINNCIECNLCVKNCEMLKYFKGNPKRIFTSILEEGKVNPILPYSCTLCKKCTEVCPKNLKTEEVFMDMRCDIARENNGQSPLKGHNAIHIHQKWGFSKLFTKYVKNQDITKVKRIFFPGCNVAAYSPELVIKTYEHLKNNLDGTAILLECCGKPTESLGEKEKFNKLFSKVENDIKGTGAIEVITACQNCYTTMKKYSSNLKVRSLWEVLREIGLPKEAIGIGNDSDVVFSIHDSCPTRYEKEIQESVRWIVDELGYKIEEKDEIMDKTNCCGTGGMIHVVNSEISNKFIRKATSAIKGDYIITYCAGCRESMIKGGVKSLHILELIFGEKIMDKNKATNINSSLKSWGNRFKLKGLIK
ncbi:(Fe-S)-binding protein [Clostridium niameyense]|uniref:(Fe-S)-binding protein n=1 Tax=Clostridium niameyense TaxID=1622073 RepID=UPI00067EC887|nr:(Fe-S)-binding protein [Clostridium niameyense]